MPRSSSRPIQSGQHRSALPLFGLAVLVALVYANAFGGTYQFDDFNVIVDLDAVHSLPAWWADLGQGIRPLLKLSYLLNWLSGAGLAGFHAVNLLIHLATTALVLRVSQEFLAAQGLQDRLPLAPWLAAALFALHPAQTEAVTYLCGRSSALMAFFYLLGLLAHAMRTSSSGSWRAQLASPLCFALALGVKETAVTFPLALLLWDLTCGRTLKTALRSSGASWTVLLVALVFFFANTPYLSALQTSAAFNTLEGNAATQLWGLFYLLGQWALPLWLNIDPDVPVRQSLAQALPALAGFIALLLSAAWAWRRRPWLAFAIDWVLLHLLLLHILLPRLDVANDRQLYLASWPLALALVVELQLRWPARLANGLLVALLAGGAVLTVLRNHDYRSEVALWEQTVQLSPHKSRVHSNLGYAYWIDGRPALARRAFLDALKLDSGNVKARLNLRRLNAEQAALNPS